MFSRKPKEDEEEGHILDEPINNLIAAIAGMDEGEEKYTAAINDLKTLMELRNRDYDLDAKPLVNPDVLVAAGAHILGIVLILGFEKANVITSKSLNFVPKIRI